MGLAVRVAPVGVLRADYFSARQGGVKYLKKAVFLADNRLGGREFLFQSQSGSRISKAKDSLAVQ